MDIEEGKRLVEALGEWERQERIVFTLAEAMIARIEELEAELDALKGRMCGGCEGHRDDWAEQSMCHEGFSAMGKCPGPKVRACGYWEAK